MDSLYIAGDKVIHACYFGAFFLLLCFADHWPTGQKKLKWAVLAVGYGLFDEIRQKFIPGRFADLIDFIADFLGIALVFALLWGAEGLLECLRKRSS